MNSWNGKKHKALQTKNNLQFENDQTRLQEFGHLFIKTKKSHGSAQIHGFSSVSLFSKTFHQSACRQFRNVFIP